MDTIDVFKLLHKETKSDVYIVGGFVRDYLRRRKNYDLDIVVKNVGVDVIENFLSKYGKVKKITLNRTASSAEVSLLLFKSESDTSGMEAQVVLPRRGKKQIPDKNNTLKQDALFRDFRVNAMYLPINYKSRKDVIDTVGGTKDIADKVINSVGSAQERMKQSPIRMLRALSISSRTGYRISDEVIEAIKSNSYMIKSVPVEAIRAEIVDILLSNKPSKYLKLLHNTGLLKHIMPEVDACYGVKQDFRYHKYDVFRHLILTVDNCERNLVLRLAGLLHDIGKAQTRKEVKVKGQRIRVTFHKHEMVSVKLANILLKRLKFDHRTIKEVLKLVRYHMYHYTMDWKDPAVLKFIKDLEIDEKYLSSDKISDLPLFKLRASERLGNGVKKEAVTDRQRDFEDRLIEVYSKTTAMTVKDLEINGDVLISVFNLSQGKTVGKVLEHLLDYVQSSPEFNNSIDLLKEATCYIVNNNLCGLPEEK